jgi:hypothetical protein
MERKPMLILIGLGLLATLGLTFLVLSCALYGVWWPLLAIFAFVAVPLPLVFCVVRSGGSGGEDSRMAEDWSLFLTGALAAVAVGIFLELAKFAVIRWAAFVFSMLALTCFATTAVLFRHFFLSSSRQL